MAMAYNRPQERNASTTNGNGNSTLFRLALSVLSGVVALLILILTAINSQQNMRINELEKQAKAQEVAVAKLDTWRESASKPDAADRELLAKLAGNMTEYAGTLREAVKLLGDMKLFTESLASQQTLLREAVIRMEDRFQQGRLDTRPPLNRRK